MSGRIRRCLWIARVGRGNPRLRSWLRSVPPGWQITPMYTNDMSRGRMQIGETWTAVELGPTFAPWADVARIADRIAAEDAELLDRLAEYERKEDSA